jgi:N-acetylneuraminic acid mutarotase
VLQYRKNYILITGGKPSKNEGSVTNCFAFELDTGHIIDFPSMISGHSSHVIIQYFDNIYVISGKNSSNIVSNNCEILDLNTFEWKSIANNIVGRTCAAGAIVNNQIFITGGCKNNTIERYKIADDVWHILAFTMPDYKWQHSAFPVGEKILIFGGEGIEDESSRNSYYFDTESMSFTEFREIPVGTPWLCGWYCYVIRGNRIWTMNKEKKLLGYNIATNEWNLYKK